MKLDDFEMEIIDLAHQGVRLTVPNVVARLKVTPTKTEAWLDQLAKKGRLDVEIDDTEGVVFYRVRGLSTRAKRDLSAALVPHGERALRGAAEHALRERFGSSTLPKSQRKSLLAAFLLGLFVPGLGLVYAAPWLTVAVATLAAVVLLFLSKIWLIGGLIFAATVITSGVAGLLYASAYNKTGKRTPILNDVSKRLPRGL